jgi:S-adenosylmethionine synthetase
LSIQHQAAINLVEFREFVKNKIIWPTLLENNVNIDPNIDLLINSYSYFHIGGPQSDSGLTGRKIIADTYGCDIPHGGGSFSGKDASKIDRTGAYVARYIAKNIVAAGIAKRCLITLNFLIGDKKVYKIGLNTFDTAIISNQKILAIIDRVFPLEVDDIVSSFALTRPKFQSLSTFGHFLHKNDDQQ